MADTIKTPTPTLPIRPQLTSSMRSSSYLTDHQQYRAPQPAPPQPFKPIHPEAGGLGGGIDAVVEDGNGSPPKKAFVPFTGIPSVDQPPTIVESGLDHSFSHPNCVPLPDEPKTARLVATLFYKGPVAATGSGSSSPSPLSAFAAGNRGGNGGGNGSGNGSGIGSGSGVARPAPSDDATSPSPSPGASLPANLAPTDTVDKFPLEPPSATEPEHLDLIYGSCISQFCITSFLHLMSGFPLPPASAEPRSSHRCLDSQEHPRVVELTLSPAPSPDYLSLQDLRKHELIYRFEREWNVDVVLQYETVWRRHPRLVVFDMDSTLITHEVIDLLAASVPDRPELAARVADITHRAMAGELDFDAALRDRLGLLKGLPATPLFEGLRPVLEVTRGVRPLLRALRRLGVRTAVLSGGFVQLTAWLAAQLAIDRAFANEVEVDGQGRLTGRTLGPVVNGERKRELLLEIAGTEGADPRQTVAVGDGANDLPMLAAAGLGVAWRAKPRVQMEAAARLNGESMLDLLYLFGFTADEIEELTL